MNSFRGKIALKRTARRKRAVRLFLGAAIVSAAVIVLAAMAIAFARIIPPHAEELNSELATPGEDAIFIGEKSAEASPDSVQSVITIPPVDTIPFEEPTITMFRGNPERNLSGVGKVPRRPKLLWRFRTKAKIEGPHEKRGAKDLSENQLWMGLGWTGQPVMLDETVYFGSSDSYVYAIDLPNKALKWFYPTHHCVKGSIAIFDETIYHGGRDNKIHAYSLDGKMRWETRTGNDMDSSPVVVDGRGYIGGEDHYLYCFNPQTGEILWKFGEVAGSIECSPCIAKNAVFFGTSRGWLYAVDRESGKQLWKVETFGDTDSTPVFYDGKLFVACATGDTNERGHLWCFSAGSGKTIWHQEFTRGFWSTAAINPEKQALYIGNANGNFYALKMKDGSLIWKRSLGARIWSSAAVSDESILVGVRDGRLWCLDEVTGAPQWVFDPGGDINATPLVSGGIIVIGNQNGWVYAIGESETDETIDNTWFVTEFPQKKRLSGNTKIVYIIKNTAPEPGTYADTSAYYRKDIYEPVYP